MAPNFKSYGIPNFKSYNQPFVVSDVGTVIVAHVEAKLSADCETNITTNSLPNPQSDKLTINVPFVDAKLDTLTGTFGSAVPLSNFDSYVFSNSNSNEPSNIATEFLPNI